MSREIPEVVRAAAGLAATVLDEARKLPQTLPGLPVRVIGMAMQKAMWLQQQYAGLVARGDELFTGIRGEDEPGLATFDEDLSPAETPAGFRGSAFDRAESPSEEEILAGLAEDDIAGLVEEDEVRPDTAAAATAEAEILAATDVDRGADALEELAIEELVDDEVAGLPAEPAPEEVVAAVEEITVQVEDADRDTGAAAAGVTATEDADAVAGALLEADAVEPAAEAAVIATAEEVPAPGDVAAVETPTEQPGDHGTPLATGTVAEEVTVGATAPLTPPVDGYDDWTIAQLRGRLRGYAAQTVEQLLAYEEATLARQPYLRMLRNRLEKVQAEQS